MTDLPANQQCAERPVKPSGPLWMSPRWLATLVSSNRFRAGLLVFVVLLLALLLRIIHLEADPSSLISRDVITDEGWWTHNARNALFHGQFRIDDYNLGIYSSPLYNFAIYATLKLFGISYTAVRLLPAACGWLTVVVLFLLVRREINIRAGLFAAVLLGFSDLHIVYSRTGFVESAMVFLLALTLLLWSLRQKHSLFSFLSGIAFGLTVITKITAIYLAPGVLLMWAALIAKDSRNIRHVIHNLLGIAVSGSVFTVVYVAPSFHDWLDFNIANGSGLEWSRQASGILLALTRLPGSFFHKVPPMIGGLVLLAFALFAVAVSKLGLKRAIRDAAEIDLVGGALFLGYFIPLALTIYQPERRLLPVLLPGVILAASLLERGAHAGRESILGEPDGWGWPIWFCILFFLPAAGIVKLTWASWLSPQGLRFWAFKVIALGLFVWLSYIVARKSSSGAKKRLLSIFSSIFVLVFAAECLMTLNTALDLWGLDVQAIKVSTVHAPALLLFAALGIGSLVFVWGVNRWGIRRPGWLILAFLLVEAIQISTWLLQPSYTFKDASSFLAQTLNVNDTVVTPYEELLIKSSATAVWRTGKRGFNLNAFKRFNPGYILILRRDNWVYYPLEQMPPDEWPPPDRFTTAKVAGFDLCPSRGRGPRFTAELYSLDRVVGTDGKAAR